MKYFYYTILITGLIIIGWLIPIDGPFDIKPEEVIRQYEQQKPHKGFYVPINKKDTMGDLQELEYIEEELYNKETEDGEDVYNRETD